MSKFRRNGGGSGGIKFKHWSINGLKKGLQLYLAKDLVSVSNSFLNYNDNCRVEKCE